MIAVWFCDSCLMAAAISEVTEARIDCWAMPDVPVVAVASAATVVMGVIVVTVSLSVSSSTPSKTLYVLWFAYPFWPDVLRKASEVRRRP